MHTMKNPGIPFQLNLIANIHLTNQVVAAHTARIKPAKADEAAVLKPISCLDLTSLSATDTPAKIDALLAKARAPIADSPIEVAAVCVYQPFVAQAKAALKGSGVAVATVAGGFPAGQMDVGVKCEDIIRSVDLGAAEIDLVINRSLVLTENWEALYHEVLACKDACGKATLKVILATGDLPDCTAIARASWVCMMAGADFIKTSTGFEKVNATLEGSYAMLRAIKEYHDLTGHRVGFKAAGGIRTTKNALAYVALVEDVLGEKWLNKTLFRIGASSLLDSLLKKLQPR